MCVCARVCVCVCVCVCACVYVLCAWCRCVLCAWCVCGGTRVYKDRQVNSSNRIEEWVYTIGSRCTSVRVQSIQSG